MFFKVDSKDRVWLLFCSTLRCFPSQRLSLIFRRIFTDLLTAFP